jgi:hypothetical protein
VIDAPPVAQDLDRLREPGHLHGSDRRLRVEADGGRKESYQQKSAAQHVTSCPPSHDRFGVLRRDASPPSAGSAAIYCYWMKFAPEYVKNVLNDNFEDAKELLLAPLMAINYAHLVMLAGPPTRSRCATRSTASRSTASARCSTTAPTKICSSTSSA